MENKYRQSIEAGDLLVNKVHDKAPHSQKAEVLRIDDDANTITLMVNGTLESTFSELTFRQSFWVKVQDD